MSPRKFRKLAFFAVLNFLFYLFSLSSAEEASFFSGSGTEKVKGVAATSGIETTSSLSRVMIEDFEDGDLKNLLGGDSGTWNFNADDEESECLPQVIETSDPAGSNRFLRLTYDVDSPLPTQNGYWTKLKNFDASSFDHLEFEVKGDPKAGFTEVFKIEIKKYKDLDRVEKIKGSAVIRVTDEWQTISIPLNRLTGVFDFSNPQVWKTPSVAFKDLDEFVVVFQDRQATKKTGVIYLDNLRFVRTGNPGPTPVDFPPRKAEKTPVKLTGIDFTKFLIDRLQGFPLEVVVKKPFPEDEREFLLEVARDTWRYFDEIVDSKYHLVLDTIQVGREAAIDTATWIGDYTNITNVGLYFMAVVSAYDLKFITQEDAIARIQKTLETLEKLEAHSSGFLYNYYDTTTLERTSYFVSLVDSGWLAIGLIVAKNAFPEALGDQIDAMLAKWDFSFFYDPVERQMRHGYYDHLQVYSDYHYGPLYSEPRAVSYLAIAKKQVPTEHWFLGLIRTFPEAYTWQEQEPKNRLDRTVLGYTFPGGHYEWKDLKYVPSWGGSAFEALMPALVLNEKELAPRGLGLNDKRHVQGQIRYALEELGYPVWGMSPSAVPEGGYSEYGAKPFGSKGYKEGVVTPHASVLALDFAPQEAVSNLRKLIELYDIYGEYGFYDAVNVKTGLVARKYLALDQGMILVAINNYLNQGAIRKRFHADPAVKETEVILSSEDFLISEPPPTLPLTKADTPLFASTSPPVLSQRESTKEKSDPAESVANVPVGTV